MRLLGRLDDEQRTNVEAWGMALPAIVPIAIGVLVIEPLIESGRSYMNRLGARVISLASAPETIAQLPSEAPNNVVALSTVKLPAIDASSVHKPDLAA